MRLCTNIYGVAILSRLKLIYDAELVPPTYNVNTDAGD